MVDYKFKEINNWSRTLKIGSKVYFPKKYQEIKKLISSSNINSFSFKAGGCSYGDCFLNDDCTIDLQSLNKISKINFKKKTIIVQCGVKIESLLNFIMPKGYYIHSVPGANNATIGGCINSNVHGKDSFKYGPFSNNISSLKIIDSKGRISNIKKNSKKFKYAIGTYGLNYLILEAELKLIKIKNFKLLVKTKKFENYKEMLEYFSLFENEKYDMMGAWVDHFSINGRGIFKAARWTKDKDNDEFKKIDLDVNNVSKLIIYFLYIIFNKLFIKRIFVKYLNNILFKVSKSQKKIQHYSDFYFPQQKYLPEESKLFPQGKVNIQILLPKKKAKILLYKITKLCHFFKMESWWLGIKKHKYSRNFLSFSLDGFDLTIQWSKRFTKKKEFPEFYSRLMKIIISNKCLIYLTQDILLDKNRFQKIYPQFKKIIKYKKKNDPKNKFSNIFYKRLFF